MIISGPHLYNLVKENKIGIQPFDKTNLKGVGYTFTLGQTVHVLKPQIFLDSRKAAEYDEILIPDDGFELLPGSFALFLTKEKVNLNGNYVCFLSTRSSIAQLGLDVSQSSFFAEPETDNVFTLEISNNGKIPIRLFKDIKIIKGIS